MQQKKSFMERKKAILNQHNGLMDIIRARQYRTLLDLGCGNAYKSMVFAMELGVNVVALDEFEGHGSTESHEHVQENIKRMNLESKISVLQGNAFDIKKLDHCFDVVFMQNVLHHLFTWPQSAKDEIVQGFFKDVYDVVNLGGLFCITDISPWNFWDRLAHALPGNWYKSALFSSINSVQFKGKTPASVWMNHLSKTGFQNIQLEFHVPYPFRHLRPLLNSRFANLFIESVYTITATKPGN